MKESPGESKGAFRALIRELKNTCKDMFVAAAYFGALSAVTYFCYSHSSPFVVLQFLFAWLIIYNSALLLFVSPAVDNVYFKESNGEISFYPLLDRSDEKFSLYLTTELFVSFVTAFIISNKFTERLDFYLYFTNTFTLALSICFWRKLIFLVRGICRYGQHVLETSLPNNYIKQYKERREKKRDKNNSPLWLFLFLASIAFWFIYHDYVYDYDVVKSSVSKDPVAWAAYFLLYTWYTWCIYCYIKKETVLNRIRAIISTVILIVLLLSFAGALYFPGTFFLFLSVIFNYLILLWAKDILLRESYVYLSEELAGSALRKEIENYILSFIRGARRLLLAITCLYFIFVILLFSIVFRLNYMLQFSKMFGLDYFFKML